MGMMQKPITSSAGTVRMSDGTRRVAYRNTYKVTTCSADGRSAETVEEARIEFLLDTNAAAQRGRKYRKASPKQAGTFVAS